jgi:DsbC/DsbD-like thiol-disulfide interchange protein
MIIKRLITASIAMAMCIVAHAQIVKPVRWSYAAKKISSTETILMIKADLNDGWHIYSINQKDGGPLKTTINFTNSSDYSLMGKIIEPKPIRKFEQVFGIDVLYFNKSVVFQQKIKVKKEQTNIKGRVSFMACNDQQCLPPDELEFNIPIR